MDRIFKVIESVIYSSERSLVCVWQFFDADGDEVISFDDMARGMSVMTKGTQDEKLIRSSAMLMLCD